MRLAQFMYCIVLAHGLLNCKHSLHTHYPSTFFSTHTIPPHTLSLHPLLHTHYPSTHTIPPHTLSLHPLLYTYRSVPYDNLQSLGVQVYGMPPGIPFHSPLLYNQQQLQQILANLEKITFLKLGPQLSQVCVCVCDRLTDGGWGDHCGNLRSAASKPPASNDQLK